MLKVPYLTRLNRACGLLSHRGVSTCSKTTSRERGVSRCGLAVEKPSEQVTEGYLREDGLCVRSSREANKVARDGRGHSNVFQYPDSFVASILK